MTRIKSSFYCNLEILQTKCFIQLLSVINTNISYFSEFNTAVSFVSKYEVILCCFSVIAWSNEIFSVFFCPKVLGQSVYSVTFKSAWGSLSNRQTCNESRVLCGLEGIKADSAGLNVRCMMKTETCAQNTRHRAKPQSVELGKTCRFLCEEKFNVNSQS